MKKIERRAIMCLLLALVLLSGLCYFIYEDWSKGGEWATHSGNRDVYADGSLAKGALYDVNGKRLLKNSGSGMKFNKDASIRAALMHITGDKNNNVSTGANRIFLQKLIGYDFVNGIYTKDNKGNDIHLTLDADVCATAYEALNGRSGTVGVYNYETGEIVCMVSSPTYDPENPPDEPEEGTYINRFTNATFAPGSTMKCLTAAAALETLSDAETWTYTCTGSEDYGNGDEVTDISAHGTVDLKTALEVSCNCYFGKLSEKLGANVLEEYISKCNLDESYNINGIETSAGSFEVPSSGLNLAWTGIGQYHDMANPCSLMVYMGAIANNGTAVYPSIINPTSIVDKTKKTALGNETKEMIDSSTASTLTEMMANNVENHYGSYMFPDLKICAKSGTAEVASQSMPNAWFAGFLNDSDNPYAFVVLVESGGYGADAAGSVANTVLQKLVNDSE